MRSDRTAVLHSTEGIAFHKGLYGHSMEQVQVAVLSADVFHIDAEDVLFLLYAPFDLNSQHPTCISYLTLMGELITVPNSSPESTVAHSLSCPSRRCREWIDQQLCRIAGQHYE